MPSSPSAATGNLIKSIPTVSVGRPGRPLAAVAHERIVRLVVDTSLHLPDMFEITFHDRDSIVLARGGLAIGTVVTISGTAPGTTTIGSLLVGEITSIEGVFAEVNRTVVRGYSADHRLQRRRRTRTFVNMKDSDIARKVAVDAGLEIGAVEQTRTAHDHVAQINQTDWEFLRSRATRIGFEFGVADGKFFYRRASGTGVGSPVPLEFPVGLRTFLPRITAGNLAGSAEVRVWDPMLAKVVAAVAPTSTGSVTLADAKPATVAGVFAPSPGIPQPPTVPDLGPPPSEDAQVIGAWPLANGANIAAAADEVAAGIAEHLGSTVAEAEAEAIGDPRLTAGATVDVGGVAPTFCGLWTITRAQHVFDEFGYQTRFEVSGRQERSLLGLTTGGDAGPAGTIPGLVCGIVSNINDPRGLGRAKVTLPWLSPRFESDWAPVAQAGAGARAAALFQPEVGDEVLVGFEFGDPQRPYVLGGLVNTTSPDPLGAPAVKAAGASASVVWRGIVTPSGNRLAFHDELPPGKAATTPTASDLVLGTATANMALVIDQTAGTVSLRCVPKPPGSPSTEGKLTIECGQMGTVDIRTGTGGTVNIDGGAQLNLTATAGISIKSQGIVEIKGNPIKLN